MMKSLYALPLSLGLGIASCFLYTKDVLAFTITDTVSATQNLYYENWGHPYNIPGGGWEFDALGTGTIPTSFGNGFAFAPNQNINISAPGCVFFGINQCGGADGSSGRFHGSSELFHELTQMSLIGIWSSDVNTIKPIAEGINPAFYIGSNLNLTTPNYEDSSYLFLGFNDIWFIDNSSAFSVTITSKDNVSGEPSPEVPEPTSMFGIFSILSLGALLRERSKSRTMRPY